MAEELPSVYEEYLQMIAPSIVPYSPHSTSEFQSPFRRRFKEEVPLFIFNDLQRAIRRIEDLQREIQRIEDLQREIQRIEDLQQERWRFKEEVPVFTFVDLERRIEYLQGILRIEDLQREIQWIEDFHPEIQRIVNDDLSRILSSHSTSEFSRFLFNGLGAIITRLMGWINGTSSIIASCAMAIHESFAGIRHEELMIGIVVFVAGYVTTQTGQKALDIATQQAGYFLAPTNVFAFFMLASLFFALKSRSFPRLEEYSAVCMTFASSSIARIILQCPGGLAWIVYLPSAIVAFVFVIPDRVHRFLFNGLGAIITRLMGWINGTSLIIASCAMAIHERFAGIRHEELPK